MGILAHDLFPIYSLIATIKPIRIRLITRVHNHENDRKSPG